MNMVEKSTFRDIETKHTLSVHKCKDGVALNIFNPNGEDETIILDDNEFTRLVFYIKGLWVDKHR